MKKIAPFIIVLLLAISCNSNESNKEAQGPSLDVMIGQMILYGFRGFEKKDLSSKVKENIENGKVGGIILFDYDVIKKKAERNIKSPSQVKTLISSLQAMSPTPLFIAIDQEGGKVNRLKKKYGFPNSVSNKYLGNLDNADSTAYYANRNSETLSELGINLNFAPDVDLETNPDNPVIGKIERSYSADPDMVTKHAKIWIDAHNKKNILSTIKHFPGHGSSHSDSHYGLVDITDYWDAIELEPFKALSHLDGVSIMTAHVVNRKLDTFPATLSDKIIPKIIREDWGFNGLIFSDDMHMAAIHDLYGFESAIEKVIHAGVDVLVFGNNLKYDEDVPNKITKIIKAKVNEGKISEERIEQSYNRIMNAKKDMHLVK